MHQKLTRQKALELWIEYKKNPFNLKKRAKYLAISTTSITRQFKLIEKAIWRGQIDNYLAYRWKVPSGWATWIPR